MNQHLHSRPYAPIVKNSQAASQTETEAVSALRAILRSRARWRDLLHSAVDLIFETDSDGYLVRLLPDQWLGWAASDLIGQHSDILWQHGTTITTDAAPNRRHVTTCDRMGRPKRVLLSVIPRKTASGDVRGHIGSVIIIPDETTAPSEARNATQTSSGHSAYLRIAPVIAAIRSAVLPFLAITRVPEVLSGLLECQTIVLTDKSDDTTVSSTDPGPLKQRDSDVVLPESIEQIIKTKLEPFSASLQHMTIENHHILIAQERLRSRGRLALLAWRERPWQDTEVDLITTSCQLLASHLELDGIHRRILENTPFDISSGLLNWLGLRDHIIRRAIRLDQQQMAATLMVLRINGLGDIVRSHGFTGDEEACRQTVELLRNAVRPSDPIARLGRNIFAFWLDGGDRFAAAERAERVTAHGMPIILDPPLHLPIHIGLVSREPGMTETPESLLERAVEALNEVPSHNKLWRFSYEAP